MSTERPEEDERMMRLASSTGQTWAIKVRTDLERDGRRSVGMWPGTVSEARRLTQRMIERSIQSIDGTPARERMARAVYDAARTEWLRWRESEPATPEDQDIELPPRKHIA